MAGRTAGAQVGSIPEERLVAPVRPVVVYCIGCCYPSNFLAVRAERVLCQHLSPQPAPGWMIVQARVGKPGGHHSIPIEADETSCAWIPPANWPTRNARLAMMSALRIHSCAAAFNTIRRIRPTANRSRKTLHHSADTSP